MTFYIPANQTVSFSVYSNAVAIETRLSNDFLASQAKRINRAFDNGEPVWMIADELRMVHQTAPTWKPTKTPRALARRVVRA
jgi:hypothetical protein